jgi:hypothetical protein
MAIAVLDGAGDLIVSAVAIHNQTAREPGLAEDLLGYTRRPGLAEGVLDPKTHPIPCRSW